MAYGGLLRTPYEAVLGLLKWAEGLWPFVNGKALLTGCTLSELWAPDFVDVLIELNVQDAMHEKPMAEHVAQVRGEILSRFNRYNGSESYGRSNDDFGSSEEPLPYIEPTEQNEFGYAGLDPPMG